MLLLRLDVLLHELVVAANVAVEDVYERTHDALERLPIHRQHDEVAGRGDRRLAGLGGHQGNLARLAMGGQEGKEEKEENKKTQQQIIDIQTRQEFPKQGQ